MDSVNQHDTHVHHGNHSVVVERYPSNHSRHNHVNQTTSDHSAHSHHQMYMYFHSKAFVFLVRSWSSTSVHGLVTALVVTAALAMLLEVVKSYLYYQELRAMIVPFPSRSRNCYMLVLRTCHTGLYCARVVMGYVLMLTAMTYNVWLVTCAIVGSTTGYFMVQPFLNFYFRDMCLQDHVTSTKEENGLLVENTDGEDMKARRDVTVRKGSKHESTDGLTSFIEKEEL